MHAHLHLNTNALKVKMPRFTPYHINQADVDKRLSTSPSGTYLAKPRKNRHDNRFSTCMEKWIKPKIRMNPNCTQGKTKQDLMKVQIIVMQNIHDALGQIKQQSQQLTAAANIITTPAATAASKKSKK
ncbi:hypothetical protein MBANPS3_000412 [Mucor bainieri]